MGESTGRIFCLVTYGDTLIVLGRFAEAQAMGIETITALVEEWQPEGRRFQVVGMFQTIDHLLDVAATLAKLRTIIAEDGIFVADILDFLRRMSKYAEAREPAGPLAPL